MDILFKQYQSNQLASVNIFFVLLCPLGLLHIVSTTGCVEQWKLSQHCGTPYERGGQCSRSTFKILVMWLKLPEHHDLNDQDLWVYSEYTLQSPASPAQHQCWSPGGLTNPWDNLRPPDLWVRVGILFQYSD